MCVTCHCRAAKPGRRTCQPCLDEHKERRKTYVDAGLCRCGRERQAGMKNCSNCLELHRKSGQRLRAVADAAELCQHCRLVPPVAGRRNCTSCLDQMRARRARLRGPSSRIRRCATCVGAGLPGLGHNRRTHDRSMIVTVPMTEEIEQ